MLSWNVLSSLQIVLTLVIVRTIPVCLWEVLKWMTIYFWLFFSFACAVTSTASLKCTESHGVLPDSGCSFWIVYGDEVVPGFPAGALINNAKLFLTLKTMLKDVSGSSFHQLPHQSPDCVSSYRTIGVQSEWEFNLLMALAFMDSCGYCTCYGRHYYDSKT